MEIEKNLVYKISFSENDDEFVATVNTMPPLMAKDDNPNSALQNLRRLVAESGQG